MVTKKEKKIDLRISNRRPLVIYSDAAINISKTRVRLQVRLSHLEKRGAACPDTEELLRRTAELENWVDKQLGGYVETHPTWPWISRIKGTGKELIGKVLGLIESFGKYYEPGDIMIPPYINREPVIVPVFVNNNGGDEFIEKPMVWVEGIERLINPSKLRTYAGIRPGLDREKGKKLRYNAELKTTLWVLGGSFMKAGNKYSEKFYQEYKTELISRFISEGKKILPTPKGRYCVACEKEVNFKAALLCPDCGEKLSLKNEPEGVVWQGHVHMMAMRHMVQRFCDHLWLVWRQALNLPITQPYSFVHGEHTTIISPWDMVDR